MSDTSRYATTPRTTWRAPDQPRAVRILRSRMLPMPESIVWLYEVTVTEGARLDIIAAQNIGNPDLAWQLYDVNNAMNPWDLLQPIGRSLRIPAVQFGTTAPTEEPDE